VCGVALQVGTKALWSSSARKVSCNWHRELNNEITRELHNKIGRERNSLVRPELNHGTASGSATAKYEKLSKRREERLIAQFPRSGKFWLKVFNEPQNIRAWLIGAADERAVGKKLDVLAKKYGFEMLHDRLIPRSRANIDHIAVTSNGVFVFDAKHYQGLIKVKYRGGLFTKKTSELWIGNRNQSKLVTGMKNQVNIIQRIIASGTIDIPVVGVLAFYRAHWETLRFLRPEKIDGVLLNSRGIERFVSKQGSFTPTEINDVVHLLAQSLPSAT
jgi:hypothetical protein